MAARYQIQTLTETPVPPSPTPTMTNDTTVITQTVTVLYQANTKCPFTPSAETVTVDKWFQQSPPVFRKPPMFTPYEQKTVRTTVFPEAVSVDRWYMQPEMPRRRAADFNAEFMTLRTLSAPVETITMDKWWQLPNQPDRRERRAASFSELTWDPNVAFPEVVTRDRVLSYYPDYIYRAFPPRCVDFSAGPLGAVPITPPAGTSKYFIDEYGFIYMQVSTGKFARIQRLN